jgi:hypothetical protein
MMGNRKVRDRDAQTTTFQQPEAASQTRAEIDAAFAGMVNDAAYRSEAEMIVAEFIDADWEALRLFGDE